MNELQEATKEFLIESHENLAQLDTDFVSLERQPTDRATLGSVFRTVHTLKGSAGFLGFQKLQSVTHVAESLLSRLRDGQMILTPELASGLLAMVDAVREILASIEANGSEGSGDYTAVIQQLTRLGGRESTASEAAPFPAGVGERAAPPATLPSATAFDMGPPFRGEEPRVSGGPVTAYGLAPPPSVPPSVAAPLTAGPEAPPKAPLAAGSTVADTTVRIDVALLDKLMALVSELVLARNQIVQRTAQNGDASLVGPTRQLNLITSEIQEEVMKTRMQPIGNIWSKFPRVVRDLAAACGKLVRLEMEGSETELDKNIIETARDPLTHLVRNAVDHGIEPPAVRRAAGKPAEGRVYLRAFHEGGQVNIEITDDGAGIDPQRVRRKALERQLITAEQAAQMGEQSLVNLIFQPGFSTSEEVTSVSGRGVGMDVVKTNIEKIGGTIDVQSQVGQGTTIKLRIPLTLAIIRALVVAAGGQRYAIPQVNMTELIRLQGDKARRGIEMLHEIPVYRYRGKLLPLVYLNQQLRLEGPSGPGAAIDDAVNIVVLQADDRPFGLVVDRIHDTQEIVVKPLVKLLKGISCFAGATLMGDGRVALILDVLGLAQQANVVPKVRDLARLDKEAPATPPSGPREQLLLVRGTDQGRMAIPLNRVARLEEFPRAEVEDVGGQHVVQYRGAILPLVDAAALLVQSQGSGPLRATAAERQTVHVVVCAEGGRQVGLVVDGILDIVEEVVSVKGAATRPYTSCTAVVQGRVTELLDLEAVLRATGAGVPAVAIA